MDDYNKNLEKNNANFVPLTPITFLERTKDIYPNYESIIYKKRVYTLGNKCMSAQHSLLVH